jgi:hypothetical protein
LVVDGADQALEIGLEAVGANLDRQRASTAIDRGRVSPVGVAASSTSTGMIWTPCAIAVSVPSQMKSPGSSMRWRRRLSVVLSHFGADDDRQGVARAHGRVDDVDEVLARPAGIDVLADLGFAPKWFTSCRSAIRWGGRVLSAAADEGVTVAELG